MERGRITEVGAHDDLLARNGTYARLYHLQFEGDAMDKSGEVTR
jgi:ABC-type multidrug transport system fused ATPase/permease subunit